MKIKKGNDYLTNLLFNLKKLFITKIQNLLANL